MFYFLLLLYICVWWIHEALKISDSVNIIFCDELSATNCPRRTGPDELSATNCPLEMVNGGPADGRTDRRTDEQTVTRSIVANFAKS